MKTMVYGILYRAITVFVRFKWYILGDYYGRLGVQARYLYRHSQLFRDRWQEIDLDFAESTFDSVAIHFFHKAQKEHILIRGRILLDSILGRPPRPYVMRDDSIV